MFIRNLVVGLFASFVTVSAKAPKARKQKSVSFFAEQLEDRALLSATMRKGPTVTGNLDGVQARITAATGDGVILAGETQKIATLTLSASRSKYFFSGLQQEILGGGSNVSGMALLHGINTLDDINPNGNGSSAYTGFSLGPISKKSGQYTFDINLTVKSDAMQQVDLTLKFPELSLRRGRRLIQLTGLLGNQTPITVKVGGNGTNPDGGGTPGFTVVPSGGSFDPQEGSSDTGTIVLNKRPMSNVTIMATSTNPDITISQASWTFTPDNWNVPQQITVNGLEDVDTIDDTGEIRFSVVDASSSNEYDSVLDQVFIGLVDDNDTNPVLETARPVLTGNPTINTGSTGTLQLKLDKAPLTTMVVNVTSNNANAVIEGQTSFTFTPSNWNIPQTVVVRNTSALVVDTSAVIIATNSVGMSSATVTLKGTDGGGGAHSVTWNVVSFISLTSDVDIQGISFQHTFANHVFYATGDFDGPLSEDAVTQVGDMHTTDANGAGITTFPVKRFKQGEHGEIRVVGTSDQTLDLADGVVILVIHNSQVYRLQQGNGLTWNSGTWVMDVSQGIPN